MRSKEPVERELFHGTSSTDAEKICADNFDRSFSGKNGQLNPILSFKLWFMFSYYSVAQVPSGHFLELLKVSGLSRFVIVRIGGQKVFDIERQVKTKNVVIVA